MDGKDHDTDVRDVEEQAPAERRREAPVVHASRWPLVVVAVAVLATVAYLYTCHTVTESRRDAQEAISSLGQAASGIAAGFRSGEITTTFVAAIPHLVDEGGSRLELATFEATETFSQADTRRVFFDTIDLGTTVTEIRVPVTYRYHLRLADPWHLEVRGHSCIVRAPAIRPTLPPAIHTDRMEKHSDRGWLRFNVGDQMEGLERNITPSLNKRAANHDHLAFVRERCRTQVAEFVRSWLLRESHWRDDRFSSVTVVFADEEARSPAVGPTLMLEHSTPE